MKTPQQRAKNRATFREHVARHERVIEVHQRSGPHGSVFLRVGAKPMITEVLLAAGVSQLPISFWLIEGVLHHGNWAGAQLPCDTKVARQEIEDKSTVYPYPKVPVVTFKRGAGHVFGLQGDGMVVLTLEDTELLLRALARLWDNAKEELLAYYPYKTHPELAEPPLEYLEWNCPQCHGTMDDPAGPCPHCTFGHEALCPECKTSLGICPNDTLPCPSCGYDREVQDA